MMHSAATSPFFYLYLKKYLNLLTYTILTKISAPVLTYTQKEGVSKGVASPYTGLCGCSMEQPYRANTLIVKSVGMLPGASAEYTPLSMNVLHIKNIGCINF